MLYNGFLYQVGQKLCLKAFGLQTKRVPVLIVVLRRYEDDGVHPSCFYYCRPLNRFHWGGPDDDARSATSSGLRLYHESELMPLPTDSWLDQQDTDAAGA